MLALLHPMHLQEYAMTPIDLQKWRVRKHVVPLREAASRHGSVKRTRAADPRRKWASKKMTSMSPFLVTFTMKFLTTTDKHRHAKGNSRKAIHEKLLKLKTTDNAAETDLVHKPSLSLFTAAESLPPPCALPPTRIAAGRPN